GNSADSAGLSIDSSLLGGIYAGRISLISTEQGVGVNTGGRLMSNEDLVITAEGRIEYASAVSKEGSVWVESKGAGIAQADFVAAKKDVSLKAEGEIDLNGGRADLNGNGVYAMNNMQISGLSGIANHTGILGFNKVS